MGKVSIREIKMDIEEIGRRIVGLAIEVHRNMGPGLLESVYERCLFKELRNSGLKCQRQVPLRIQYKGEVLEEAYYLDLLVNDTIVIELKAVEEIHPLHIAQVITYLKLSNNPVGYLINFNTSQLRHGIRRIENRF